MTAYFTSKPALRHRRVDRILGQGHNGDIHIVKGENNKPGAQRRLTLSDGGTVKEQLVRWDNAGMSYTYKILDSVLPVSNYESTISVKPEGGEKSRLTWKGQFDPAKGATADKARTVITSVYDAGLNKVDTMMAGY